MDVYVIFTNVLLVKTGRCDMISMWKRKNPATAAVSQQQYKPMAYRAQGTRHERAIFKRAIFCQRCIMAHSV